MKNPRDELRGLLDSIMVLRDGKSSRDSQNEVDDWMADIHAACGGGMRLSDAAEVILLVRGFRDGLRAVSKSDRGVAVDDFLTYLVDNPPHPHNGSDLP